MLYFRPIAMFGTDRPKGALTLAGGWCWFAECEVLTRGQPLGRVAAGDLPPEAKARLTAPRPPVAGLTFDAPTLMGILNVTPDSFSDGGRFDAPGAALAQARALAAGGAGMIDVGGESTRPGAAEVSVPDEIARTAPVIAALRDALPGTPLSVDTRKAAVAGAALTAGAALVNDVSALTFDPGMAALVAERGAGLCLMHAQGTPATMQADPRYEHVLLDVYDALADRIAVAETAGIPRAHILVDPGIGFGKTVAHNLALLRGLSLFHGLGCAILLGVSRKRFIGTIGDAPETDDRLPGTVAVTLAAIAQGVQVHRVHDTSPLRQAIRLWQAVTVGTEARGGAGTAGTT
jgi:dihydropteroate synthase